MRKFWLGFVALTLVTCVAAAQEKLGGPGNTQAKYFLLLPENTFAVSVPLLATHLKQSEAKVIHINLRRGENFDQDVMLSFENLPRGVTIEPAQPAIKHGDKGTEITVKASDAAALGHFAIRVKGHPQKGADALNELKLTVSKK